MVSYVQRLEHRHRYLLGFGKSPVGQACYLGVYHGCVLIQFPERPKQSPNFRWSFGRLQIERRSFLGTRWYIEIPAWLPFTLFAAYPIFSIARGPLRRYRRRKRGWCIHCGYDLTGNVSGVCSECGEARQPLYSQGSNDIMD